jgi:hypothetical protein
MIWKNALFILALNLPALMLTAENIKNIQSIIGNIENEVC